MKVSPWSVTTSAMRLYGLRKTKPQRPAVPAFLTQCLICAITRLAMAQMPVCLAIMTITT